jgi:uncharacterized iron-regulated membrane protein
MPRVSRSTASTLWTRCLRQPQKVWLRRALFQVHLWLGVGIGLYVLMISVTGSVLVYRNELYNATRADSLGYRLVSRLLELHDDLLAGEAGRTVNGVGAVAILVLASTGVVIWWPGLKTWRRSLTLPRGVGWRRATWHLHSLIGFWTLGFTVMLASSGAYLGFPDAFQGLADRLDPPAAGGTPRISDDIIYWLAYLHFGRINGIGIPCGGPGVCDQTVKAIWAVCGLAPAVLFVTGAVMWWSRVVRPRRVRGERSVPDRRPQVS